MLKYNYIKDAMVLKHDPKFMKLDNTHPSSSNDKSNSSTEGSPMDDPKMSLALDLTEPLVDSAS